MALLNTLQADFVDPAGVCRAGRKFKSDTRKLFLDGRVLSKDNRLSFTTIILAQLKSEAAFLYNNEALGFDWEEGTAPEWARNALARIQVVVAAMHEMLDMCYSIDSGESLFEAFDLEGAEFAADGSTYYGDLFRKLCRFRGWLEATSQFKCVQSIALHLWKRGKRETPEEAVKPKYNQLCWFKAYFEMRTKGHALHILQRALSFYASFQRNTCDTERDIGVLTENESGCLQKQRDLVAILRHGPEKLEELCYKALSDSGEVELLATSLLIRIMQTYVHTFGLGFARNSKNAATKPPSPA